MKFGRKIRSNEKWPPSFGNCQSDHTCPVDSVVRRAAIFISVIQSRAFDYPTR